MSVFFRCDSCGDVTDPRQLYRVTAVTSNLIPHVIIDLHCGDLCLKCVNAIKAMLPQDEVNELEEKEEEPEPAKTEEPKPINKVDDPDMFWWAMGWE